MSFSSPTTLVQDAIGALESAVAGARGQGFGSRELDGAELIRLVELAEHAGRYIDALRTEVAHEVDARTLRKAPDNSQDSLAHSLGYSSSYDLLQRVTLASPATVAGRIRMGKACRTQVSLLGEELPGIFAHVGEALFQGELALDAAEVIARSLGSLPAQVPYDHVDLAERNLVSHATGTALVPGVWEDSEGNPSAGAPGMPVPTKHVRDLARGWVAVLDQDGTVPKEEVLNRRFVRLGEARHGLIPIHGALLPETAAALNRMLDAINNPRAADNTGDGSRVSRVRFVHEDEVSSDAPKDSRTADQKRHDAFATIVQVAMKHDDMPTMNGEALTLTIQVTEEDLRRTRGTAWIPDASGTLTPVDSGAARHASCAGTMLRVTQNEHGRITSLGTAARVFNAHQRRAIMLRDGGCIIPGCGQPASWCEVHHVTEWRNEGKTHTDNGVLLCWFHHRHLDTHGWNIRMRNGTPEVKAPPWLDPDQEWRVAGSITHQPPQLPAGYYRSLNSRKPAEPNDRTERPTETSACEVRDTSCIPAPRSVERRQPEPGVRQAQHAPSSNRLNNRLHTRAHPCPRVDISSENPIITCPPY